MATCENFTRRRNPECSNQSILAWTTDRIIPPSAISNRRRAPQHSDGLERFLTQIWERFSESR
jgi:hypothetical protein